MKDKKEIILQSALKMFNGNGFSAVTMRQIAESVGMSAGNLNYHFQKKEEIVIALYDVFKTEINQIISTEMMDQHLSFEKVESLLLKLFKQFWNYRFIFLDFARLMKAFPNIRKDYILVTEQRLNQFSIVFEQLVNQGVFRQEAYKGQYQYLYNRLQFLTDFWISYKSLEKKYDYKSLKESYIKAVKETLFPYLNDMYQKALIMQFQQK